MFDNVAKTPVYDFINTRNAQQAQKTENNYKPFSKEGKSENAEKVTALETEKSAVPKPDTYEYTPRAVTPEIGAQQARTAGEDDSAKLKNELNDALEKAYGNDTSDANTDKVAESGESAKAGTAECETCANRQYQDGSDDASVSFKNAAKIAPEAVASTVRGHEYEHVRHEQQNAKQDDRKILSQTVSIHTAVCPECGKSYVSGGETRTITAPKAHTEPVEAEPIEPVASTAPKAETKPTAPKSTASAAQPKPTPKSNPEPKTKPVTAANNDNGGVDVNVKNKPKGGVEVKID
ncbi:MAG: hypothetical protein LBN42_01020 [Oscillospiraceae bacterium]|jgi:hypothetical protein|nr:hypothetical protein [Oscillospiraceae bacterium]